jgi:hypothetical protein
VHLRFSHDELVLALVSVVRAVNPRMLETGADGFTVNLGPLEKKTPLTPDEQFLLKLSATLAGEASEMGGYEVELLTHESKRLVETLARLERLQNWPKDVLEMSRSMRERLGAKPDSGPPGGTKEGAE